MSSTVAEMSRDELREIIESSIEQKLTEFFRDPDAVVEINKSLRMISPGLIEQSSNASLAVFNGWPSISMKSNPNS